jgi:hypothetical protein
LQRGPLPEGLSLEALLTLICAGPECEVLHCGPISDNGDQLDIAQAFRQLRHSFSPLEVLGEYSRARNAARALVRTPWARRRVPLLVEALQRHRTLSGDDIAALLNATAVRRRVRLEVWQIHWSATCQSRSVPIPMLPKARMRWSGKRVG